MVGVLDLAALLTTGASIEAPVDNGLPDGDKCPGATKLPWLGRGDVGTFGRSAGTSGAVQRRREGGREGGRE